MADEGARLESHASKARQRLHTGELHAQTSSSHHRIQHPLARCLYWFIPVFPSALRAPLFVEPALSDDFGCRRLELAQHRVTAVRMGQRAMAAQRVRRSGHRSAIERRLDACCVLREDWSEWAS